MLLTFIYDIVWCLYVLEMHESAENAREQYIRKYRRFHGEDEENPFELEVKRVEVTCYFLLCTFYHLTDQLSS